MIIKVGDTVIMKKPHPCGNRRFTVMRTGVDLKLKCCGCGHVVEGERSKLERNIKLVETEENNV